MTVTFTTAIIQAEGKNATGIEVPPDAMEGLGAATKRPAVVVTVNGYTYRSTVAAYEGPVYLLPLAKEHRDAAGLSAGDTVEVTLALDTAPRTVEVPAKLADALEGAGLRAVFDGLAPSARKEHVRQVTEAKSTETRDRRIGKIVEKLTPG